MTSKYKIHVVQLKYQSAAYIIISTSVPECFVMGTFYKPSSPHSLLSCMDTDDCRFLGGTPHFAGCDVQLGAPQLP